MNPTAVAHVYGHRPLTAELAFLLNPEVSIADLRADVLEIGYPEEAGLNQDA